MLKMVLREKHPLKSEKEIFMEQETISNGFIQEWQWKKIAHKMYEFQDASYLCQQLSQLLAQKASGSKENAKFNIFMS